MVSKLVMGDSWLDLAWATSKYSDLPGQVGWVGHVAGPETVFHKGLEAQL